MKKDYTIGIDIGTNSVGWAVVNTENYKLIRKGNKNLWGALLFEEGQSAKERRNFRGTRIRYNRRKERIKLLNEMFKKEIEKVDNNFITTLKEFYLWEEDKTVKNSYSKQQVKDYHYKYPTIYHLRNDLINKKEKMDIRYIYMAIHHIIKYRGNFLYNISNFDTNNIDIKESLKNIFEDLNNNCEHLIFNPKDISIDKIDAILNSNNQKMDKKKLLINEIGLVLPKQVATNISNLIIGFSSDLSKIFDLEESLKISFKDMNYEEKIEKNIEQLGNNIEIVNELKQIYDMLFLKDLFKGKNYSNISQLMVDKYNKHGEDLEKLRKILKVDRKIYNEMFFNEKQGKKNKCAYTKYIDNNTSYGDFKKIITKYLDKLEPQIKDKNIIENIKEELENETFIPKITSVDNGIYPYQLNQKELIEIIENQKQYYPFLGEKVDGEYKLVKLLKFRIPYYVGHLNPNYEQRAWIVKNSNEKITPFNFDKVVNKMQSAENFIMRMISNCTYLLQEKAIPDNSILYSKYKVLNELKQISIVSKNRTDKLPIEFQKKIYNDYFLKTRGPITNKKFINYLNSLDEMDIYEGNFEIKGYSSDGGFANNMNSYIDFFGENGIFTNTDYTIENAEEIIKWITIFEDKEIVKEKLQEKYPILNEEQKRKILSKNYKGWSRLSEKLLTEKWYLDKEDNKKYSIIDLLETTDKNFMQIINDKEYDFQKFINDNNNYLKNTNKISYSLVSELATSPATKKGIYQTLKIIDEIVDYMGYEPKYISIEMARKKAKNPKIKDARKRQIEKLYEKCKNEISNYDKLNKQLKKYDDYKNINPDKLFLYFMQEGKCLYCGEPLDITSILTDCEIDHIIPQTLIKDDSIDNKALVHKKHNQEKAASFVLPKDYRNHQNSEWWKKLLKNGLMSNKKFNSLVRSKYSDDDINRFIDRQLVETRQITKHVANILDNIYKDTNIIYLKANLSSNYRKKYHLFKFRDLNDYHHAHDAYLAAVLGLYKNNSKSIDYTTLKEMTKEYIITKKYKELHYGYIINSTSQNMYDEKTGEVIFDASKFNETIENTLYQNDIIINKKTEIKTGAFYNQNLLPKSNTGKGHRIKDNLPIEKYGHYDSIKPSYICLVKYGNKQKLIGMPIVIDKKSKKDKQVKIDYIRQLLNLKENVDVTIVKDRIPFNSLLIYDNKICSIVGASNYVEVCNALEFNIDKTNQIRWKYTLHKLLNNKSLESVIALANEKENSKKYTSDTYEKQLDEILKYIIDKMESKYILFKNVVIRLKSVLNGKELTIEEKEKTIKELLNLLKYNSVNANLKFLSSDFSDRVGRQSKLNISYGVIINKSITGIKEAEPYEF